MPLRYLRQNTPSHPSQTPVREQPSLEADIVDEGHIHVPTVDEDEAECHVPWI